MIRSYFNIQICVVIMARKTLSHCILLNHCRTEDPVQYSAKVSIHWWKVVPIFPTRSSSNTAAVRFRGATNSSSQRSALAWRVTNSTTRFLHPSEVHITDPFVDHRSDRWNRLIYVSPVAASFTVRRTRQGECYPAMHSNGVKRRKTVPLAGCLKDVCQKGAVGTLAWIRANVLY